MKKSRQTKRSSKRMIEDLKVPAAGRKSTKNIKGGRERSAANLSEIVITKPADVPSTN